MVHITHKYFRDTSASEGLFFPTHSRAGRQRPGADRHEQRVYRGRVPQSGGLLAGQIIEFKSSSVYIYVFTDNNVPMLTRP